jgi:hypothetical protein
MKYCSKCSEEKELTEFYKNSGKKDGLDTYCKTCRLASAKVYREKLGETSCKYCDRPLAHKATGLCRGHQYRLECGDLRLDDPIREMSVGYTNAKGYRLISKPEHSNAHKTGYIYEHVYVMSEHIGRPLLAHENVHHKNGVRDDNRLENLELWSLSQPPGQRVEDKIAWAIELLKLYKPDILSA